MDTVHMSNVHRALRQSTEVYTPVFEQLYCTIAIVQSPIGDIPKKTSAQFYSRKSLWSACIGHNGQWTLSIAMKSLNKKKFF